jgi:hypothetical protein
LEYTDVSGFCTASIIKVMIMMMMMMIALMMEAVRTSENSVYCN